MEEVIGTFNKKQIYSITDIDTLYKRTLKIIGYKTDTITVDKLVGKIYYGVHKKYMYNCNCLLCGKNFITIGSEIITGKVKSCGCLKYHSSPHRKKKKRRPILNKLYNIYIYKCNKRDIHFELDLQTFEKLVFNTCYYCGVEPKNICYRFYKNAKNKEFILYNGIDRSDNNIGYIKENCVTCCYICNQMKSNLTLDDFYQKIERIFKYKGING